MNYTVKHIYRVLLYDGWTVAEFLKHSWGTDWNLKTELLFERYQI
jgi:hypothetical protein